MALETGLATYLQARAGLTALITGTDGAIHLYPLLVPQVESGSPDNYPAVTFQTISFANLHSLGGVSGIGMPRVQITAWARTMFAALAVRDQLVDALDGYRGLMGAVTVQSCLKIDERDLSFATGASPELSPARVFGRSLDFKFSYTEAFPSFT